MEITNAVSAKQVCSDLRIELLRIRYNPDLKRMLSNIDNMASEISKLEVICRQSKSNTRLAEPLVKLNEAVTNFRDLLLIAHIME